MGKNDVEVINFHGKKWLNEKKIQKQLKHSNLPAVKNQYSSELKKQRQEIQGCGNHQPCRRFLEEDFAIQIIMDCRTTPAVRFKAKLGFNQQDPIMTQEQSILSKIVTLFVAEEIILQHNVLGYRIDAYFPKYKLAIEVDEQGHEKTIKTEKQTKTKKTKEFRKEFNKALKRSLKNHW